jgi:hypothetical protein
LPGFARRKRSFAEAHSQQGISKRHQNADTRKSYEVAASLSSVHLPMANRGSSGARRLRRVHWSAGLGGTNLMVA